MNCPNKNTVEWKTLVDQIGEEGAYKVYLAAGEELPSLAVIQSVLTQLPKVPQRSIQQENIALEPTSLKSFIEVNGYNKTESQFKRRGNTTYDFLFKEIQKLGVEIEKGFIDVTKDQLPAHIDILNIPAFYNPTTNKIGLTPTFNRLDKISQTRLLAHEAIHAVLESKIKEMNPDQLKVLEDKINEFIASIKSDERLNEDFDVQRVLQHVSETGWHELITYAMTDAKFASVLNSIIIGGENIESKSFWTKLKEIILSVISDDYTKLDQLNTILDTYMNMNYSETSINTEVYNQNLLEKQGYESAQSKIDYLSEYVTGYSQIDIDGESIKELCK